VSQVQYSLQRGLSAKAGAGQLAAAYFASAGSGSSFPNASYPGWNAVAYALNTVAQVRGIAWLPLVTPAQLPGFWAYANDTIGVQWANATIQQCGFVNETDFAAGVATVTRNIHGGLFAGNASVHLPVNASAAFYFPLIHHAPIHTNEAVIMYDLHSEPVRARTIDQVLATQAAATTDWLRLVQDTNANLNRIGSLALTPVIVNGVVVGISNTVFNWDSVLLQALPTYIRGLDAVLSSGLSNRTFTMRIDAGAVSGVGPGDQHEHNDELAHYARAVSATLGTTWTVTLYPTRAMLAAYQTTGPRDRCIAVLVVIIICIALFALHDWLARSRSVMLVRLVQATSRIVEDVFPKNVRARMVKQAMAEVSPPVHGGADAPLSQGAVKALGLIQKFVGIEQAQTRAVQRRSSMLVDLGQGAAPIADTFPAVTVLFSDIVGFTNWSANVPPEVVFRMLGSMFREFDQLAHRLGIFKARALRACMRVCVSLAIACLTRAAPRALQVETIGDAYMAVCGLPEPTAAHAERMADFALGMFAAVERACVETGADLGIRVGMHSGSVTAGVLMGERSRFQLFGAALAKARAAWLRAHLMRAVRARRKQATP
jgi:class 3 adenylate cyclase